MRPLKNRPQTENPFNLSNEFMAGLRDHFFIPVAERRAREEQALAPMLLKLDPTLQEFVVSIGAGEVKDVLLYLDVKVGGYPAWLASDSERASQQFEIRRDLYQKSDLLEPLVNSSNAVFEYDDTWVERGVLVVRGASRELISKLVEHSEVTSLIAFRK